MNNSSHIYKTEVLMISRNNLVFALWNCACCQKIYQGIRHTIILWTKPPNFLWGCPMIQGKNVSSNTTQFLLWCVLSARYLDSGNEKKVCLYCSPKVVQIMCGTDFYSKMFSIPTWDTRINRKSCDTGTICWLNCILIWLLQDVLST